MLERYFKLLNVMDKMVAEEKMNQDNPIIRSIGRKLWKMYKSATKEEKIQIDAFENIYMF